MTADRRTAAGRDAPSPIALLIKVLEHEQKQGFRDQAVIGGLDQMLREQRERADPRQQIALNRLLAKLPREGYRSLRPEQRDRWVADARALLRAGTPPAGRQAKRARPERHDRNGAAAQPDPPTEIDEGGRTSERPPRKRARPSPAGAAGSDALQQPVASLGRLLPQQRDAIASLGIETIHDMLWHLPARHEDWRNVQPIGAARPGEKTTVIGELRSIRDVRLRGGRSATEARIADGTGEIGVWWWNQPYLAKSLKPGDRIGLSGPVSDYRGRPRFDSPVWERMQDSAEDGVHVGRLTPVYPMTRGIQNRTLRRLAHRAVSDYAPLLPESLPARIRGELRYPAEHEAIAAMHFPERPEDVHAARERIAFQELLAIQLAVLARKREARLRSDAPQIIMDGAFLDAFLGSLPFQLTNAQQRALTGIREDMMRREPMARLLQGDVGSGKTVVAAAAMLATVKAGCQAVLMAPTEVLAQQHFQTFSRLFSGEGESVFHEYDVSAALGRSVRMALLSGSLPEKRKREIRDRMAAGELDLVVGTHALIQESTALRSLGLAVVDEQHRFGVLQRDALRGKSGQGGSPHLLVMTATPIPRTLALTLYGELDNSVIDELPPGRVPIGTRVVDPAGVDAVYERIRAEVAQGNQAFIICPLIEESETVESKAAAAEFERLRDGPLRDLAPRMRLLHGRMKADEKRQVMDDLASGDAAIVVATIVVEVGVDLPRATVMAIEGAERFGLAQLHQLRGRVGRSDRASICYLISGSEGADAQTRLRHMERTSNGFELAEIDLETRGPGEYFGTRQAGLPDLRVAKLTDHDLINQARNWANRLLDDDPNLRDPELAILKQRMQGFDVSGASAVH